MNVDLSNTYWERIRGYPTELRVDARWLLRMDGSERTWGSLRIVSHPDLPAGYLRAFFTFVKDIKRRSEEDQLKTIEDYQMDIKELEVYSIDEDLETESETYEAPFKELEQLFDIKVFS